MWTGSAAVCIDSNRILMVLQGKPEEEKRWSVPSGGKNMHETYEECCVREVLEETGYLVHVKEKLMVKNNAVHYFSVEVLDGQPTIQDPDGLIYQIEWKTARELSCLDLCFEEDRAFLMSLMMGNCKESEHKKV